MHAQTHMASHQSIRTSPRRWERTKSHEGSATQVFNRSKTRSRPITHTSPFDTKSEPLLERVPSGAPDLLSPTQSPFGNPQSEVPTSSVRGKKRSNNGSDRHWKRRRLSDHYTRTKEDIACTQESFQTVRSSVDRDTQSCQRFSSAHQLPSPTSAKHNEGQGTYHPVHSQSAEASNDARVEDRSRELLEQTTVEDLVEDWLSNLPIIPDFQANRQPSMSGSMSQPATKRSRSIDLLSRQTSQSGTETPMSRDKKYSVYRDTNYVLVLETKGSFLRDSEDGLVPEDLELCGKIQETTQATLDDPFFDDAHFRRFQENLRGRSEARICIDLHPRFAPSVENLFIIGRAEFGDLREGYNDIWSKCVPFYHPRPQPDHTYGYKWSCFTDEQRRKLGITPTSKSPYTARDDIYFPFFTVEVKCGQQSLDFADRANANSMSTMMQGIVGLYRKLNQEHMLHRRILGFSMSHNDNAVCFYAHYPEIRGNKVTYWRHALEPINYSSNEGGKRLLPQRMTLNICQLFASAHLDRIRSLVDQMLDPLSQSLDGTPVSIGLEEFDASREDGSKKSRTDNTQDSELRYIIVRLEQQLERQRQESERQRQESERERSESARILAELQKQNQEQLAEQRKEAEEQRKKAEEQFQQLMQMLKQRGD